MSTVDGHDATRSRGPRARVRDSLRAMTADGVHWDVTPATVFRNLLLDRTGSDARPLAELLVEAAARGWVARLAPVKGPISAASWDAFVAPFVLQWSVERFVQPEMARWAVDAWGLALGVIEPEAPRGTSASVTRSPEASGTPTTPVSHAVSRGASAAPPRARLAVPSTAPVVPPASAAGPRRAPPAGRARHAGTAAFATVSAQRPAPRRSGASRTRDLRWATGGLVGVLGVMTLALLVRVSAAANGTAGDERAATGAATTAPGESGTANGGGATAPVRGAFAPPRADSARMLFVEPPRRASGEGRRLAAGAPAPRSTGAQDEARLVNGTRMRGRVELVRSGTVIFHDAATGLRHELRKEEIDEIVTEFGTSVRFRSVDGIPASRGALVRTARDARDVRTDGLAGRYVVRYGAPAITGSRDCTDVWGKAPGAEDTVVVRHLPGADTLTLAIVGGDQFPSNVDDRGAFASTIRIMPGGARTSTGLTTRVSGRMHHGGLDVQVNLVFYRRMRTGGDVTCNVTVPGEGRPLR